MDYRDFHSAIVHSTPDAWRFNGDRYIYLPDINITLTAPADDKTVPDLKDKQKELGHRFGHIFGTSQYRLYYSGTYITGERLLTIVPDGHAGMVMIPFPFGFTDDFKDKPVEVSILDHHVCMILSLLGNGCGTKEQYDGLLERGRVVTVPYEDGLWYLKDQK